MSYGEKDRKTVDFLGGILTSQFNLITDPKVRAGIISVLHDVPEETLAEKLLKSYLYLMIGNITRSDNILRGILRTPPAKNWVRTPAPAGTYHRLARENIEQLIKKLSRHPADRRVFQLLAKYVENFYTDPALLEHFGTYATGAIEEKLDLKYVEGLAPEFVRYLRLKDLSEERRVRRLRQTRNFPWAMQSAWVWPFLDIDPLVSESMSEELQRLEKEDELWFVYVMDNEKLADAYSKKSGKSFLPGRRQYLRSILPEPRLFMASLFKLIEFGDINPELTQATVEHLTRE